MFSSGRTLLAIDLPAHSDRIAGLWELVRAEALAAAVLDEVVSSGLSSAPSFVLIGGSSDSATTILVRGKAVVRLAGPSVREISGEGVSSWVEQVVDVSHGFEFHLGTSAKSSSRLPLASGVVRADAVGSESVAADSGSTATPAIPAAVTPTKTPAPAASPTKKHASVPPPEPSRDVEITLAAQTTTISPIEVAAKVDPVPDQVTVPPAEASDGSSYDHLFGETVFRKVEDAAVRDAEETEPSLLVGPPPSSPEAGQDDGGDHDGHTVMVSDISALRAKRKAARAATAPEPIPTPTLYLELSTGGRETLDQPLIIGRAPSATRVSGGNVPRLVSMNTPNQDISRTHAQITAEGGTVVVTDLHSSNGTTIILPGKPAQKLRPGEPSAVIVGTIIDLGDGATLTVCESS